LAKITEDTDLHSRALRHHYVEIDGEKWEIDTVQLVRNPEPDDIVSIFLVLADHLLDIPWKYETMIFKIENEERVTTIEGGATSFGYYRSNESEDVVKAHDQIVQLVAEGWLSPVEDEEPSNLQISPAIVKAMTQFDTEHPAPETMNG